MSSPYRGAPSGTNHSRPRDAGIVGEIIDQFEDTFAFYRELIQNALDAESEFVEVEIRYSAMDKILQVSVTDFGCGMSREIIEEQLLVLFRSTKENERDKIGKFGIGFISVLATSPSLVQVITRCKGLSHTLHLYPDLRYKLFQSGSLDVDGTKVCLEIPMQASQITSFVEASYRSLDKWCRHAAAVISFDAWGAGGVLLRNDRIDRPLGIVDTLVSHSLTTDDGLIRVVVGICPGIQRGAFYNKGLLLHEIHDESVGRFSFVVQDHRLGHTLSRDNVLRDANYYHALEIVESIVKTELPATCIAQLRQHLVDETYQEYEILGKSILDAEIRIEKELWPVPIFATRADRWISNVHAINSSGGMYATEDSECTEILARAGVSVLYLWPTADKEERLCLRLFDDLQYIATFLTVVKPVVLSSSDENFVDSLSTILGQHYRQPSKVIIANLVGANSDELYVVGDNSHCFLQSENLGGCPSRC